MFLGAQASEHLGVPVRAALAATLGEQLFQSIKVTSVQQGHDGVAPFQLLLNLSAPGDFIREQKLQSPLAPRKFLDHRQEPPDFIAL
jgi:hypothetical protein